MRPHRPSFPRRSRPAKRSEAELQADAERMARYQRQFVGPALDYDDPSPDADDDPKDDDRDEEGRPR